jgi:hypothetical protein
MSRPFIGDAFRVVVGVSRDDGTARACAPSNRVVDVTERDAQDAARRLIDERIGVRQVFAIGSSERRIRDLVYAGQQLYRARRATELVEKHVEACVGRNVETRYWISHLGDSSAERVDVLGALPLMERQGAFHFPNRFGRELSDERCHEATLDPVESEQPSNVVLDRIADARSFGVGREASELGDAIEWM